MEHPHDGSASSRSIVQAIADSVATGALASGDRLPSVRDIMAEYGVAKVTAERVQTDLVRLGVAVRKPRSGLYVSGSAARDQTPELVPADEILASRLGIAVGEPVCQWSRSTGTRVARFAVPADVAADVAAGEALPEEVHDWLGTGRSTVVATEKVSLALPADLVGFAVGLPIREGMVCLERIVAEPAGRLIQFCVVVTDIAPRGLD